MICVSLAEPTPEAFIKGMAGERMVEIRLDYLQAMDEDIELLFNQSIHTIATCREGNFNDQERKHRLKLAMNAGANYVDIEFEADPEYRNELIEVALKNNTQIIISYHNHEMTPESDELTRIVDECFEMKADICKLSTMAHNQKDNARILAVYNDERRIIAFAMGEVGKFTRLASTVMGAEFTYAAKNAQKTVAPGQIGKHEMEEILERINDL